MQVQLDFGIGQQEGTTMQLQLLQRTLHFFTKRTPLLGNQTSTLTLDLPILMQRITNHFASQTTRLILPQN
jgi:hypothetical protein